MSDAPGTAQRNALDIFISHAAEDRARARSLAAALERHGYQCFVASDDLNAALGTQTWGEAIDALLASAPVLVVLVSEFALGSKWVTYEWRSFHDAILGELRAGLIVPILWDRRDLTTLPAAMRHWQVIDLARGLSEQTRPKTSTLAFDQMCPSVRSRVTSSDADGPYDSKENHDAQRKNHSSRCIRVTSHPLGVLWHALEGDGK